MKYFSEKTKQLYSTPEALQEDEKKYDEKQAELKAKREAEAAVKRERAAAVEAAFKAAEEADKKAEEAVQFAKEKRIEFLKLRNAFVHDFGAFHMTVHKECPIPRPMPLPLRTTEMDELNQLLNFFFM